MKVWPDAGQVRKVISSLPVLYAQKAEAEGTPIAHSNTSATTTAELDLITYDALDGSVQAVAWRKALEVALRCVFRAVRSVRLPGHGLGCKRFRARRMCNALPLGPSVAAEELP